MKPHRWGILLLVTLTALLAATLLATMPKATSAQPQGCMILTPNGYAPDTDCDGVIDALDNCPTVANADQTDSNRNGIGDACDLLISEIMINPDNHIRQGQYVHMVVRLVNNRDMPLNGITVNVRNKDLGIDAAQQVSFVPVGEQAVADFWLAIPKCAKVQSYPISITSTFKDPSTGTTSTEAQSQTLYVENGSVCGTPSGALDNTIIKAFDQVDIDQAGNAIVPITISNMGSDQATYDLAVGDLGTFGTWRIDPNARLVIPAGQDGHAFLYLQTETFTQPGTHEIDLSVTSGQQRTVIPIKAYVRSTAAAPANEPFFLLFQILIILLVLALIVIAIAIAVRTGKKRRTDGDGKRGQHTLTPYYDNDADAAGTAVERNHAAPGSPSKAPNPASIPRSTARTAKTVAIEPAEKPKVETYY